MTAAVVCRLRRAKSDGWTSLLTDAFPTRLENDPGRTGALGETFEARCWEEENLKQSGSAPGFWPRDGGCSNRAIPRGANCKGVILGMSRLKSPRRGNSGMFVQRQEVSTRHYTHAKKKKEKEEKTS